MSNKTILIVEDDKSIREMLSMTLEAEGYRVTTATNGHEGLTVLRSKEPPCLVLLDLEMPVMDGLEFLQQKAGDASLSGVPVVLISAVPEKAKGSPANHVLKKPIDHAPLMSIIRKFCGSAVDPSLNQG